MNSVAWTVSGALVFIVLVDTYREIRKARINADIRVKAASIHREGICGNEAPKMFVDCAGNFPVICELSFGHRSTWHEADTGQRWRKC